MIFRGQNSSVTPMVGAIPGITADCLMRGRVIPIGEAERCYHEHNKTCGACREVHDGHHPCKSVPVASTQQH